MIFRHKYTSTTLDLNCTNTILAKVSLTMPHCFIISRTYADYAACLVLFSVWLKSLVLHPTQWLYTAVKHIDRIQLFLPANWVEEGRGSNLIANDYIHLWFPLSCLATILNIPNGAHFSLMRLKHAFLFIMRYFDHFY